MEVTAPTEEVTALRGLIREFLQDRLQAKLDKLKPDEISKREQLEAAHELPAWLTDAARRVAQIQLASHTLKPIHPDARGTNIHVRDEVSETPGLVGTHGLSSERDHDVVGNAAALDVFKFLSLEYQGRSILLRVIENEATVKAALTEDPAEAERMRAAFASIAEPQGDPASHTLAKQLYFPLSDGGYHLLAPLFPTTLVHRVQQTIREHRFGDTAKAARDARREGKSWPHGYHEYPELAIRKLGGTKPQNISQLNSERYGENWLLASKPPLWETLDVKPPLNTDSIFDGWFSHRRSVREAVNRLRDFLSSTDHNNLAIRKARARMAGDVCDEAHQFAASLRGLPGGWTADTACKLHEAEQLWLDPLRAHIDEAFRQRRLIADWRDQVSKRFSNWLNSALESKQLKLDEFSAAQWADDLVGELNMFREVLDDDAE